ncbi:MAG: PilT/PilU family type 4a pilus ATPase [Candidatus Sumerlaeaceae bacterium]|nr:PilT/PilU family type 4a pilus ATPase [Candidatus Sumerlaeaceae bacterium]
MRDDGKELIDLALRHGVISASQAKLLLDELEMFPGQKVGNIMLKRQFITAQQLMDLQALAAGTGTSGTRSGGSLSSTRFGRNVAAHGSPLSRRSGTGDSSLNISRVNLSRRLPEERKLFDYIRFAAERHCTDLHLVIGRPPFVRQAGEIHYLKDEPLTAKACEALNFSVLDATQRDELLAEKQLDFGLQVPGAGRVRGNICRQRLGWEGAYRIFPPRLRSFEELGLPPVLKRLADYSEGLILVTGSVGSGKNTTVAAMIEHINRTRDEHIVTVEDPIEYVFEPVRCSITQREIGLHSQSFAVALRAALRQDPDIIFVGEMRDLETISIAITAAETGHLVFGTLHTSSAARTVGRIVNAYPPEQRAQVCMMVADSLRGIVAQHLIPRRDGKGVALAQEILIVTPGVAQAIKDGKTHQLVSLMQAGKKLGMKTMDESLAELVERGIISGREAYMRAESKAMFESVRDNK